MTPVGAHLVSYPSAPINRFWYGVLIHFPFRLSDGLDNGMIGLKGVQRRDGILSSA